MWFRQVQRFVSVLLIICLWADALATDPDQTVRWSVALASAGADRVSGQATLQVSGEVLEGWHVYALTQRPGGPTALRLTLDENDILQAAGPPTGTAPRKKQDQSFGIETQFYERGFTLSLPVQFKRDRTATDRPIQVNVRFQSCSDRECLPPTTVRLSVPLEVPPNA